jgi:hypothetical protein
MDGAVVGERALNENPEPAGVERKGVVNGEVVIVHVPGEGGVHGNSNIAVGAVPEDSQAADTSSSSITPLGWKRHLTAPPPQSRLF